MTDKQEKLANKGVDRGITLSELIEIHDALMNILNDDNNDGGDDGDSDRKPKGDLTEADGVIEGEDGPRMKLEYIQKGGSKANDNGSEGENSSIESGMADSTKVILIEDVGVHYRIVDNGNMTYVVSVEINGNDINFENSTVELEIDAIEFEHDTAKITIGDNNE